MRAVGLLLGLAACNRAGDRCDVHVTKCEGDTILTCHQAGANDDFIGHKSNYYRRTDCPAGTHCLKIDDEVGCADPAAQCDPTSTQPIVADHGMTIDVKACTHHVGTNAYLETVTYTTCDLRTFKAKCIHSQAASACMLGDVLEDAPPVIREALRGKYVETATWCSVCGDPTTCHD